MRFPIARLDFMTVGSALSTEDRETLKVAAFGAVFLVSNADPGLLDMVTESFAAAEPIAGSTGLVRDVLTTGPLPQLPVSPAEVERDVLPALRRSVEILREKAPHEVENFQSTVLTAAERTAAAVDGVSSGEVAMVGKVREALDVAA